VQACSLVDLVKTIAEIGGARCPDDWDGDSMVPWLDDASVGWKDLAVSEYYAHNISSGFAMIRQGRWKYTYHTRIDETHGPERELYDLVADPGEFENVAGLPEHAQRIAGMHDALVRELGRDPEEAEAECRRDQSAGYLRDDADAARREQRGAPTR
jgi:choline-sulfatase